MAGVETIEATLIEEEEIYYVLLCQSFHLTSFAALVDVHGIAEVRGQCILECDEHKKPIKTLASWGLDYIEYQF